MKEMEMSWAIAFQWAYRSGHKEPVRFIYTYDGSDSSRALDSKEAAIAKLMQIAAEYRRNSSFMKVEASPDNTAFCAVEHCGDTKTFWVTQLIPMCEVGAGPEMPKLARYIARNWHHCPLPENAGLTKEDCYGWGSDMCPACLLHNAALLPL